MGRIVHGTVHVTIHEARGLKKQDYFGQNDNVVFVSLDKGRVWQTPISEGCDPQWNSTGSTMVGMYAGEVNVEVYDIDTGRGKDEVGKVTFPIDDLMMGTIDGWYKLDTEGEIRLTLYFEPARPARGQGVGRTYFEPREECKVTLYGDAEVPEGSINAHITLEDNHTYRPASAWRDLSKAINGAQHFIYIAGWSVYTEITLIREPGQPTLGEMLKRKAEEGVRVLVMPWDEKLSFDDQRVGELLGMENGMMMTHDEETEGYFRGTGVHCHPVGRIVRESAKDMVGVLAWECIFTHHQKTVVLDAPCPNRDGRRRVIGFMGGIDLCDGRYDTPQHPLFRSLQDAHSNDFHQANIAEGVDVTSGPREPWHDIHCKVEGMVARDLMQNFHERWSRQNSSYADALFDVDRSGFIRPEEERWGDGSDSWNVQLLRSIDSEVANFQHNEGLVELRGRHVERSIQDAYIHHIRRAEHFLYIENQYFMGSSFGWEKSIAGCENMIPAEIALKIASKIRAGERFAAYILTPMHPEGAPSAKPTQELLQWQYRTMQFMYNIVSEALRDVGSDDHPTDWLAFFCLGNRETAYGGQESNAPSELAGTLQRTRRHMIYVHSKMLIVDDELIIVGSANINQRSMAGYRDTEIATSSWQPAHTATRHTTPKGNVYGFRARLWAEHLGHYDSTYDTPSSLECIRQVNETARAAWQQYLATEPTDMHTHLMPYPVAVHRDGTLGVLDGVRNFPDYPGECPIEGAAELLLPNFLTF
eukprot:comp18098_c0_seq1/m.18733 comp18098_c0_seq1/g.18733  ORF comp18098_c0_seq1/g.18733 comp18098_c0_seq1/m.18733 type:complete len:758 (-) comp18098_c0_seq1:28-2301(-)